MVDIIDCEECAKYGACKPDKCNPYGAYSNTEESFRLFQAKTDDISKYCPYCKAKLYRPKTTHLSNSYKETTLQCRNQACWAVEDEIKNRKKMGETITGDVWVIVGYIEEQVRLKRRGTYEKVGEIAS